MDKLNLKDFEWKILVRPLTIDDYDELRAMAEICFPGIPPLTREQLESQLTIFPQGQLAIEIDGRLAAAASSLVLEYSITWSGTIGR